MLSSMSVATSSKVKLRGMILFQELWMQKPQSSALNGRWETLRKQMESDRRANVAAILEDVD